MTLGLQVYIFWKFFEFLGRKLVVMFVIKVPGVKRITFWREICLQSDEIKSTLINGNNESVKILRILST